MMIHRHAYGSHYTRNMNMKQKEYWNETNAIYIEGLVTNIDLYIYIDIE